MNIQKIKTFVQDNKTELAYIAGLAIGYTVTAVVFNAYHKGVLAGEQWERIDAFENTKTHELVLNLSKVNGSQETVTIWPTEQHLATHTM